MGKRHMELGSSHCTHTSYYKAMKKSDNTVLVIENVAEYKESIVQKELGGDWEIQSVQIDPRLLGLPCCRTRVFMLCWKRDVVRWVAPYTFHSFIACLTSQISMSAVDYFFKSLPKTILSPSAVHWQHICFYQLVSRFM